MEDNKEYTFDMFRLWLEKQDKNIKMNNTKNESLLNKIVVPRLGLERLEIKIKENNKIKNVKILAENFKNNGGKVLEEIDLNAIISVNNKKFTLPKIYIKLA